MTDFFPAAFALVVGLEGRFSEDPHDPGNWTGGKCGVGTFKGSKYGISAAAYPQLDIRALTLEQARAIYQRDYWGKVGCQGLPWDAALMLFDCAVNQGPGAAEILWRAARADPLEFAVQRALRYVNSAGFARDGTGWLRRLFSQFKHAQQVPT